jgi:hypothetical protein
VELARARGAGPSASRRSRIPRSSSSGLTAAGYAVEARYSRASPKPKMAPCMNPRRNRWLLALLGQRSSMFPWRWSSSPSSAKRV